ncbi:MAG: universal stress protein UspE [Bacteroidetes bacterium]|jgi:nucleotide-binding universal stress UspA family protein|nr:universal stress protein UspE [Bacteroidota bacterium]
MLIKENGSILIPIDYSKQSLSAIKHSYSLAKQTKSKLILMHAYNNAADENKANLDNLAKQTAAESGLEVETLSVKGDIFDQTDKMAEKYKTSLIVAGLDTHVRFRSFLGRSSASKFIRNAPCPVLTVRTLDHKDTYKNIVLPFDLTPQSREKVPIIIQIAQYYKADIRIVSVFDPSDSKYENKLLPYLQQVKKYIKEKHVNATNKSIPAKNVAEAIVDYANKNECDLIVQMNKTDTSFGEMFSGTASQEMVDISNIPVLTINPMKRADMPLSY